MESSRLFFGSNSSSSMFFLGNGDDYFRGTRIGEESSKKRPFFSSMDDMLEEEYYDEQLTEKKRRLSPEQVLSLTEKLQSKEVLESSTAGGSAAAEAEDAVAPLIHVKAEDHFSTGSGGSAVVDDHDGPQLVDSGDSYFPDDDYPHEYAAAPVDQSEEDDGSDNGHNDLPYPFATTDHHQHEEADVLG
ncbi:hypothetical protein M8C21_011921, partial [Ambrosia artemisiifolia]